MSKMLLLLRNKGVSCKRLKVGSTVNYQFVNDNEPRKAASVVEHKDGELNVVDRQWREYYNGYNTETAIQNVLKLLGL